MDWYYPVLGGALTGAEAKSRIEEGWDRFVVPGLGVRCVVPNPWVTGGESAELALALWVMGESDRALEILQSIQHLRDRTTGMYWTGYVFEDDGDLARGAAPPGRRGRCCSPWPRWAATRRPCAVFGGERLPRGAGPGLLRLAEVAQRQRAAQPRRDRGPATAWPTNR